MNKILFTGCTHYGHYNVIKYCNRPFKTLEEMNETLIKRANERASDNTIIYHLGDFCFKNSPSKKNTYLQKILTLKGNIKINKKKRKEKRVC